jgi:hypothetical protein
MWHIYRSYALQYLQHDDDRVAHIEGAQGDDYTPPLIGAEVVPCYGPALRYQQEHKHLPCFIHLASRIEEKKK